MSELKSRTRQILRQLFAAGQKPTADEFVQLIDSFLSLKEDGVKVEDTKVVIDKELFTGKVGIAEQLSVGVPLGDTCSTAKLQVDGNARPQLPATTGTTQSRGHVARLRQHDNAVLDMGGNSASGFWLQSTDQRELSNNYPLLLNPNGGNVGIGTNDPKAPLHINLSKPATADANSELISRWTRPRAEADNVINKYGNAFDILLGSYGTKIESQTRVDFRLNDGPTNLPDKIIMTLQGNGNVGIGTSTPLGPLSIGDSDKVGSDGFLVIGKRSAKGTRHFRVGFDEAFNFCIGDYGSNNKAEKWNSAFVIQWAAPDNSLFIDHKGNVGIGTSQPLGPLSIGDSSRPGSDGFLVMGKKSGGDTRHFRVGIDDAFNFRIGDYGRDNKAGKWTSPFAITWDAPDNSLFIDKTGVHFTGKVGIAEELLIGVSLGDTSSTAKLQVNGKGCEWPATKGTTQSKGHVARFRGCDNAVLDMGGNSQWGFWLQSTNQRDLVDNYPLLLNPNGGNVGIGTTNPMAPLHVKKLKYEPQYKESKDLEYGVFLGNTATEFAKTAANTNKGKYTISTGSIAALFDGQVVARDSVWVGVEVATSSDRRAKNIAGLSDGAADLGMLLRLQIKDYTWIDRTKDQLRPHKKLIAQDVEQVFPQAVSINPVPQVIPSVYEMAEAVAHDANAATLTITTKKAHGFQVGDKVDLYADNSEMKAIKVKSVTSPHQFIVASGQAVKNVFVYGREVNDFRTIDYDAISMLNVSATQELAQRVEAQAAAIIARDKKIAALERRLCEVESRERSCHARLLALEALLGQDSPQRSPKRGPGGAAPCELAVAS